MHLLEGMFEEKTFERDKRKSTNDSEIIFKLLDGYAHGSFSSNDHYIFQFNLHCCHNILVYVISYVAAIATNGRSFSSPGRKPQV